MTYIEQQIVDSLNLVSLTDLFLFVPLVAASLMVLMRNEETGRCVLVRGERQKQPIYHSPHYVQYCVCLSLNFAVYFELNHYYLSWDRIHAFT
jgi:hypothetical protein